MRRKPRGKKKLKNITVVTGDVYRVPREGKRPLHVRIVRMLRYDPRQPKVNYILVTCSGKRKERKSAPKATHWLTWRDKKWRLPENWVLVERRK